MSINDFGTGYSSLAALRKLPAAELKVDRAFVQDLATSEDARSIVRAIVQMAHSLQLRVVAEGVETEAQRDVLLKLGCDELQGYLFAKPMTATVLALWADGDNTLRGQCFGRLCLIPPPQRRCLNRHRRRGSPVPKAGKFTLPGESYSLSVVLTR